MNRLRTHQLVTATAVITAALFAASFWAERNVGAQFLPHGFCFTWIPGLLWLHVASDALIGLAYISIPVTLLHFVRRRSNLPYPWMFLLFALFIIGCGITHLLGVWTVWNPDYWVSGAVKAFTAAVSLLTAAALVFLIPKALALPTTAQLQAAKEALEAEVRTRRTVEEELRRAHDALERRVEERTAELQAATALAERSRAEAEAANRMKDQFLAKVSHELRTPLQATLGWVQVLGRPGLDAATAQHAKERVQHNVRAQARLIDDLLDISRILSGKLRLDLAPADPAALVAKAVDMVRPAAERGQVALELDIDAAGARIVTDAVRLEQVVWNLVGNAVQASGEGGRVRLAARIEGERLRLRVSDSGRGIDARDLPFIFEPFHQGRLAQPGHRGLGLGLAITRSIVELLGGEIRAASDGPGKGAVFEVDVPVRPAAPSSTGVAAPPPAAVAPDALAGLRLLLVEDEDDIARALGGMLGAFGAEVTVCATQAQALAQLRAARFDLLLSDLDLGPGGSGIELVRALRATGPGGRIPAVALSAHGRDEDRRATAEAGFARHLVKPVEAEEVARAVLAVLREAGPPA